MVLLLYLRRRCHPSGKSNYWKAASRRKLWHRHSFQI